MSGASHTPLEDGRLPSAPGCQPTASPDASIAAGCAWLRELADNCKLSASVRYSADDDEVGDEWRVRGESYAFIADQIECGHSPFTDRYRNDGAALRRVGRGSIVTSGGQLDVEILISILRGLDTAIAKARGLS